jgi:hypothetical protein
MILIIIIFFITIIGAFGMLMFRSWEIRTNRIMIEENLQTYKKGLSFREIEKIVLHTIKHIIQWVVVSVIKLWFLIITKLNIWLKNKSPKLNKFFRKKEKNYIDSRKISFVERAVMESKIKIKKVKEKIKKEHEELQEVKENNEVDKIV